ncbi:MAG: hypothetical protein ACHQX1_03650 [Candidatus Micrarchaeales archaeon]
MDVLDLRGRERSARVRRKAIEALKDSDLTEVFETAGIELSDESAGAALKAVLAERLAECTIRAMKEAKRRGMKLGAAAVIIAAQQK